MVFIFPRRYRELVGVTVFGKQDSDPGVDDGPIGYAINLLPMISGDANYNGKTPTAVPFTNLDDDCVAVNDTGLRIVRQITSAFLAVYNSDRGVVLQRHAGGACDDDLHSGG